MTLKQLEYFQAICRYGNITRAADELRVSQPSLSYTIKELEAEFRVSLFRRLSKGLALTREGEILLEEVDALLKRADQLTKRMGELSGEQQTIQLGVPPMLATLLFPRLLSAAYSAFPNISLKMAENGTLINRELVRTGKIDAAIVSSDEPPSADLAFCDLCSLRICFYAPTGRASVAEGGSVLKEACGIPLVCLSEDSFLTDYMNRQFSERGLHPEIILHTNQLGTIRQLIGSGMAGAFLYDRVIEEDERIVKLPVPELPRIQVRLVWDASRKPSGAFRHLVELCRKEQLFSNVSI